jgi:uncharacterized membrane protein YsdA (DUF1294 family)/cold shock CspA family protein
MRHQGKITEWKDDRGFGFITPKGGGEKVFVHIKSFSSRQRRPVRNEIVTYELVSNQKDRTRAEQVGFMNDSLTIPAERRAVAFALPGLFLLLVAAAVFMGQLPLVILGLYLVASAVSFLLYANDKSAAEEGRWRTSENTLHMFSLIGGWPGAFVAQKLLRHKSRKESFQILFWTTVVLNCVGLAWLFFAIWGGTLSMPSITVGLLPETTPIHHTI